MRLPDFLVVGAAKSGTTSLYHLLRQHPDIFMSAVKEPGFFALKNHELQFNGPGDMNAIGRCSVNSLEAYTALFDGAGSSVAAGEASNIYLYSPEAPPAIKAAIPDVKLIAMLRDPVERAFSAYLMMLRDKRETLPFRLALRQAEKRAHQGWSYMWQYQAGGRYAQLLQRYLDLFPQDQLLVLFYDDFVSSPESVLNRICVFLGVGPARFTPLISNQSRDPIKWPIVRSDRIRNFVDSESSWKRIARPAVPKKVFRGLGDTLRRWNMLVPQLDEDVRQELRLYYYEDTVKLEKITGRDLAAWKP
ncbi:MAG TPA: sulfotransferase [Rhodothermales bacterium]|nr:sulfotransferase [Rhodothermales bacterium]